jgi:hypothetical protein
MLMANIYFISPADIGIFRAGMVVGTFICPVQHPEQERNAAPMAAFRPSVKNSMKNWRWNMILLYCPFFCDAFYIQMVTSHKNLRHTTI